MSLQLKSFGGFVTLKLATKRRRLEPGTGRRPEPSFASATALFPTTNQRIPDSRATPNVSGQPRPHLQHLQPQTDLADSTQLNSPWPLSEHTRQLVFCELSHHDPPSSPAAATRAPLSSKASSPPTNSRWSPRRVRRHTTSPTTALTSTKLPRKSSAPDISP